MNDKPILFREEMVRAILEGRKTQTRRVVKPQIPEGVPRCPYGVPGDRLWVRETWRWYGRQRAGELEGGLLYRADLHSRIFQDFPNETLTYEAFVKAWDENQVNVWRSSIYMPRWASRITLEVTAVCVERVQSISEEDVIAEGIVCSDKYCYSPSDVSHFRDYGGAQAAYRELWDSINGKKYPWANNPWVWVVEFRCVAKAEDVK